MSDIPSQLLSDYQSDLQSHLPHESTSDLPSYLPDDLQSESAIYLQSHLQSDLPSDLWRESVSDLPTESPSEFAIDSPSHLPNNLPSTDLSRQQCGICSCVQNCVERGNPKSFVRCRHCGNRLSHALLLCERAARADERGLGRCVAAGPEPACEQARALTLPEALR